MLSDDPAISCLSAVRGALAAASGDLVYADVAREAANDVVDRLLAWTSSAREVCTSSQSGRGCLASGYEAERRAPGSSADSVVWADVTQRAYEESELNWTHASFMIMATLIAGIAIVSDSQIWSSARWCSVRSSARSRRSASRWSVDDPPRTGVAAWTLTLGFAVAILDTTAAAVIGRALGWVTLDDITGPRPATAFIYTPDKWSFIVAVIAAAAAVPSLTSARSGWSLGRLHLGHDGPRRWQCRTRAGVRGVARGVGQTLQLP